MYVVYDVALNSTCDQHLSQFYKQFKKLIANFKKLLKIFMAQFILIASSWFDGRESGFKNGSDQSTMM